MYIFEAGVILRYAKSSYLKLQGTVFRQGRTLLDQGCPNFDEIFFGASAHEKIEI